MNKDEIYELLYTRYNRRTPIPPSTLPEIDLYMDQVTTFMEDKLKKQRRYPEDKILTKTMINNYTKNKLLPPPVKKKYNQDHLLTLIYTYYLKNILSISDINTLLTPMIRDFWTGSIAEREEEDSLPPMSMKEIYEQILSLEPDTLEDTWEDVRRKIDAVDQLFSEADIPEEAREYLQKFSFCILLVLDIYMKKQMLEQLIDDMK